MGCKESGCMVQHVGALSVLPASWQVAVAQLAVSHCVSVVGCTDRLCTTAACAGDDVVTVLPAEVELTAVAGGTGPAAASADPSAALYNGQQGSQFCPGGSAGPRCCGWRWPLCQHQHCWPASCWAACPVWGRGLSWQRCRLRQLHGP